jgi:hypothetical protein
VVAPREHLVDHRVGMPGYVDHDGREAPAAGRERLAHREGLQARGPVDRPGQHRQPVAPRQGLPQGPGTEPAGGLHQGVPADAVDVLEPEHAVDPGAPGIGVDHEGAPVDRAHLGERRGEHGRSHAAGAADDPDGHARRSGAVADVGERLDQPGLRERQRRDALRADREGVAEELVGQGTPAHDVHPGASGRTAASEVGGPVGPDQDQGCGGPRPERGRTGAHDLGRHSRRGGEPDQLTEQQVVVGDHQRGNGVVVHARHALRAEGRGRPPGQSPVDEPRIDGGVDAHRPPGESASAVRDRSVDCPA